MLPIKDRLPFAIRFASMDLDGIRQGDWINLEEDIVDFVGFRTGRTREEARKQARRIGVSPWPWSGRFVLRRDKDTIRALQADVRGFLNAVMARHEDLDAKQRGQQPECEVTPDIPEIHLRLWLDWNQDQPEDVGLLMDGTLRDMFLHVLSLLLSQDMAHMRRCPECQTIFYRVRKQRYCTRTCTNRANMRAFRQTAKGKELESDLNHERYKARVRRKTGPNAQVLKRPRSKQEKRGE
jgi:hypothetical protein